MAMQAELKVSSQQVLGKSGEMKGIRTQLSSIMEEMKQRFVQVSSVWDSEASTAFRNRFNMIHADIERMLKIVDEYTHDLDEVANAYRTTEQQLENNAGALPGNIF